MSQLVSKIFRWQPEQPGGPMPVRVEVAGSFNDWQRVALKRDRVSGVWQVTVNDIPANRTHTYMLLVNGRPVKDKHADGLAIPQSPGDQQHQLETPRGPRVFLLASQTK
jgi:1,4-alpha-glucan branching enzyme